MHKKSQIALEFVMLLGSSIAFAIIILLSIYSLTQSKADEQTYFEIDDYARSVQREFMVATTLEDGYARRINVPQTINGRSYNISIGHGSTSNSYLIVDYKGMELYYILPALNGNIVKGNNFIIRRNNAIYVNSTG